MKTIDAKSMMIGFLLCTCGFLFMGQSGGNLGDIEVNSITVKDDGSGGYIRTYNSDGKETMYAGTGEGGIGMIRTFNSEGTETMYAGTVADDSGMITINNKFGNMSVGLSQNDNEDGLINLFDKYGEYGWGMTGKK